MAVELSDQEVEEFRLEASDLLEQAENAFLAVEGGDSPQLHYDAIFRAFHSVKGAAGMMERSELQELMHWLESSFLKMRDRDTWPKAHIDTFLKGIDRARIVLNNGDQKAGPQIDLPAEAATPDVSPVEVQVEVQADDHSEVVAEATSGPASVNSDIQDFLTECDERLAKIAESFSNARKLGLSSEELDNVYRDVHTLKGAAGLYNFRKMEEQCHRLESELEIFRSGQQSLDVETALEMLKAIDGVAQIVDSIRNVPAETVQAQPETQPSPTPALTLVHEPTHEVIEMKKEDPKPAQAEAHVASPATPTTQAAAHAPDPENSSIRVQVSLLDRMMVLMGELVLVRNQVMQFSNQSDDLNFVNLSKRLSLVATDLQTEVMKTRMQPIGSILGKFQRTVRDLSRDLSKKIELELHGVETELDRTLIEAVKDPLMHVIRNACDHGIETPSERLSSGKSEIGTVRVRAFHEGGQVVLEISDDGRGVDQERIIQKAIERGLVTPEKARLMTEREVIEILFAPGFSTAAKVTNVSGRGVGMDVVKSNIEKIGGSVEISSQKGKGSSVRLRIPLTLAIVPAMIIVSGSERYAIPQVKLLELVRTDQTLPDRAIELYQGQPVLRLRGDILPLVFLNEALGLGGKAVPETASVVVVTTGQVRFGLIVDEIQDTADIVVKPLPSFLKGITIYSGATVMGDGSVTCILDVEGIADAMNLARDVEAVESENKTATEEWGETQDYLVFKLKGATSRYAAILNLVNRIEEFPTSAVEQTGHLPVVRYRGGILPLFSATELLGLGEDPILNSSAEKIRVLVTQRRGRAVGLVVSEILDVLSTSEEPDTRVVDREGIMGNLVKGPHVTVIVDLLILLDVAMKQLVADAGEFQSASQKKTVKRGEGRKLLLVEDSPLFRKKIATALEAAGFEVETAHDGLDALAKIERRSSTAGPLYALVTDIEMPRMDGWELLSKLKALNKTGNMKLIAVTSKDDAESRKRGQAAGFHSYLAKFDASVLVTALLEDESEARSETGTEIQEAA